MLAKNNIFSESIYKSYAEYNNADYFFRVQILTASLERKLFKHIEFHVHSVESQTVRSVCVWFPPPCLRYFSHGEGTITLKAAS